MTIALHSECELRLIEVLTERLGELRVQNRIALDSNSIVGIFNAQEILPKSGKMKNDLDYYISERPLYDYLFGSLSRELLEQQDYDAKVESCKLNELPQYTDLAALARRLISEFKSLPWNYSISIKLNEGLNILSDTILIPDQFRIIRPDEAFSKIFPPDTGNEKRNRRLALVSLLTSHITPVWDEKATYMQLFDKGFIGKYIPTSPIERSIAAIKAFCGIAIALRLLKVKYTYRPVPLKSRLIIHKKVDSNWILEETYELDDDFSKTLGNLEINDLDGKLDTPSKREQWVKKQIGLIQKLFQNPEEAEQLRLAGQWVFDSYCGTNELLSFVQTIIALEILLGDKTSSDQMGVGELLRNRCAYLIGKTHKQREEILEEFRNIYQIRSKIVHRGKSRLTTQERLLYFQLQWICRRVIQEEVDLIIKAEARV